MEFKKFNSFSKGKEKVGGEKEDLFDNKKERPVMTFAKLLEDLKGGNYNLEQVKNLPVLVNGKPIDRISFGGNGGVDFISKE